MADIGIWVGERSGSTKTDFCNYGIDTHFIVILNVLPLPADVLTLILGMVRYDFKKGMIFTILGKILKFILLGALTL